MSKISQKSVAVPGDKLSTIEEFVPGEGSATIGEHIIATVPGSVKPDMVNRIMNVIPAKSANDILPKVGDYIIGLVDSAQSSVAQITILALNDIVSEKELSAMLSLREDRRRKSPPIKSGDIIRAKIFSTKNSIYHLTLDGQNSGVVRTACTNCGGEVIMLGRDRIKCKDCGLVDERLLANDFTKDSRYQGNV